MREAMQILSGPRRDKTQSDVAVVDGGLLDKNSSTLVAHQCISGRGHGGTAVREQTDARPKKKSHQQGRTEGPLLSHERYSPKDARELERRGCWAVRFGRLRGNQREDRFAQLTDRRKTDSWTG